MKPYCMTSCVMSCRCHPLHYPINNPHICFHIQWFHATIRPLFFDTCIDTAYILIGSLFSPIETLHPHKQCTGFLWWSHGFVHWLINPIGCMYTSWHMLQLLCSSASINHQLPSLSRPHTLSLLPLSLSFWINQKKGTLSLSSLPPFFASITHSLTHSLTHFLSLPSSASLSLFLSRNQKNKLSIHFCSPPPLFPPPLSSFKAIIT
jgi:hypothetical protein